jgi:hypothetical protein
MKEILQGVPALLVTQEGVVKKTLWTVWRVLA